MPSWPHRRLPKFSKTSNPADVTSRAALAKLPVTRKHELLELQLKQPQRAAAMCLVASARWLWCRTCRACLPARARSTSPKARPKTTGAWRAPFLPPVFAPGELIHNSFSYHFVPAGSMMETGAHALGCTVFPGRHRPDRAAGAGHGRTAACGLHRHPQLSENHCGKGRGDGRGAAQRDQGHVWWRGLSAQPARLVCASTASPATSATPRPIWA